VLLPGKKPNWKSGILLCWPQPVLNDRAQNIGIQSVQRATHSDYSAVAWICHWSLFVHRRKPCFFPGPGTACLCHEHVEKSGNVWSYHINIFLSPAIVSGHSFCGIIDKGRSDCVEAG